MPKLTGNILFTGSLGNLSAYKRRGSDKIIMRTKGGASKSKIKTDPAFTLTRMNNTEFGGASTAGAFVRQAVYGVKHLADPELSSQLTSFTSTILKLDIVNARGQRAIHFSQYRQLLEGFNLNRQLLFNTVIRHSVTSEVFRNTGSARLLLPGLLPGINIYTPPQYHLYRFIMVLGTIPDILYMSTVSPEYGPAQPVQYNPEMLYTDWFSVKEPWPAQSFNIELKNFTSLPNSHSLVLSIGIEFGYPLSNQIVKPIAHAGSACILATG